MASKKSVEAKSVQKPATYWAVPRLWLIALMVFFVAAWLALAAIWLKPKSPTRADVDAARSRPAGAGRWGELTLTPIIISPPMELVSTDWGFMRRPAWAFPGASAQAAAGILQSAGVSPDAAGRLCAEARPEAKIGGVVLSPDPAWVRALPPETRSRIYRALAKSELNRDQSHAFRYRGSGAEEWLDPNLVSPRTRQLVEPLLYRDGSYMLFSDIELVRAEIGGEEELRLLGKALLRQSAVMARLSVGSEVDLNALVEYWGRGGRRTEIRPLLESLEGGGADRFVDVAHLLPPFVRNHLYSYPKLSSAELDKPAASGCLWTPLNFFQPNPDDRFLDDGYALKTLRENYFIVETDFELGDVVVFLDEKGEIFHAAAYIADNLVFGKNGIPAMAPWILTTLDDVKAYYRSRCETPRLIVHRRKTL